MTNRAFKTGTCREQTSFLPRRIEDYVGPGNVVRAIDAYVGAVDMRQFGFRNSGYEGGAGQPPYDPADLLKLYLYGYLNRIRSSRYLEREAQRNLELIWLLKNLAPGYRTIAKFRKDNWAALRAANREFVVLMRELNLVSGALVAIDGAFFHGDASKESIRTSKGLADQVAAIDRDIEAYGSTVEANDAGEAMRLVGDGGGWDDGNVAQKLAELRKKREQVQAELAGLKESGETQSSSTDADARLMSKGGQLVVGYNVQVAVDEKHKLIVATEVVNDGNDSGQLYEMAKAAQEALGTPTLEVVADTGYYNGPALKDCEENGIAAYVPPAKRTGRLEAEGRFTHEEFAYDAAENVYRCPAGEVLRPTKSPKVNGNRREIVYLSRKSTCAACPLRVRCLTAKADRRTIYRWEHQDVIDRHRVRMENAGGRMRQRSCLVEHPFGTLKCRAGYRHFLVRGLNKVRGEWSLMALCYNFSRVLTILGLQGFIDYLAKRLAARAFLCALGATTRLMGRIRALAERICDSLAEKSAIFRFSLRLAV
jgi:transposase